MAVIINPEGRSCFTFNTPPGKGPILVRRAQNPRRIDGNLYIDCWKPVEKFSRRRLAEAQELARQIGVAEVVEEGRRGTVLVHARYGLGRR